jgi:hypothetical protein
MLRQSAVILGLALATAAMGCSSDGGNAGTAGGGGGGGGAGGAGGSQPVPCTDDAECDDENECTDDTCTTAEVCENTPVEDLTDCTSVEGGKCVLGQCSTGACVNEDDLAKLASGEEPPLDTTTDCSTDAATIDMSMCPGPLGNGEDASGLTKCLLTGNDGMSTPSTLSEACLSCTGEISCCILNLCSVLSDPPGPCAAAPQPGDLCDICIQEKCAPDFNDCSGLIYELPVNP